MRIDILTIFPTMFTPLQISIVKRAVDAGIIELHIHDLRDYTEDLHKTVDDAPYGGGAGMVMKVSILHKAVTDIKSMNVGAPVIFLSPQGKSFDQNRALELSKLDGIILVCAHYEGVDERFVELCCDEEISIGNYVLTGGELPAMVVTDAVARMIPGVIDSESAADESFMGTLLDHPHYTRPPEFLGLEVPEVLRSGNHALIDTWRKEQRIVNTWKKRPELLKDRLDDPKIKKILNKYL